MLFQRGTALRIFLYGAMLAHLPLHARAKLPLGGDICEALVQQAGAPPLTRISSVLEYSPGWGVGTDAMGIALKKKFSQMMQHARDAGQSEEQLVMQFFEERAYSDPDAVIGKYQAPSAPSHEQMKQIQETVNQTSVDSIVESVARQKGASSNEVKDGDILTAFKNIERGSALSSDDLEAIGRLHSKVRELSTRSEKLRGLLAAEGQADLMIWDYIKRYDKAFRQKISNALPEENLYIAFPEVHRKTGKLFIDVRKIDDLDGYERFYADSKRKGEKVIEYNVELRKYAWDYLKYRYMANRLKAIEDREVTFHLDLKEPDADDYTAVARHEEILDKEKENQIAFDGYRNGIIDGLDADRDIHPHPAILSEMKFRKTFLRNAQVSKNWYLTTIGAIITGVVLKTAILFVDTTAVEPVANFFERDHALDEEYWIKKCSGDEDTTKEQVFACIRRWARLASAAIDQEIEAKKKLDPHYVELADKARFAMMSKNIVDRTIVAKGFIVNGELLVENDLMWIPQNHYAIWQKEVEKYKEKLANLQDELAKAKIAAAQPGTGVVNSVAATSGANVAANEPVQTVKATATKEAGKFKAELLARMSDLKKSLPLHKNDQAKQMQMLWEYQSYLTLTSYKLSELEKLELGDDFAISVSALGSLIKDESEQALVLVQKLVPPATPPPQAPSAPAIPGPAVGGTPAAIPVAKPPQAPVGVPGTASTSVGNISQGSAVAKP